MSQQRNRTVSNSLNMPSASLRQRPNSLQSKHLAGINEQNDKSPVTRSIQDMIIKTNKQIQKDYQWSYSSLDENKRNKEFKSKFTWKDKKSDIFITLKGVFYSPVPIDDSDTVIELDSANVALDLQEQKLIQKIIDKILPSIFDEQSILEGILRIKDLLLKCHKQFKQQRLQKKRKQNTIVLKNKVNQDYIMYQAPVSLSWSPHGFLCLTQNKLPNLEKPILGKPKKLKASLENPQRNINYNNIYRNEESILPDEQKDENQDPDEIYEWDFRQEVEFLVLKDTPHFSPYCKAQKEEIYTGVATNPVTKTIINNPNKCSQLQQIGNRADIPQKLEKAAKIFFSQDQTKFLRRQDKLKVYIIHNQLSQFQEGFHVLYERIKEQGDKSVNIAETILMNESKQINRNVLKQESPVRYLQVVNDLLRWKIETSPHAQLYFYFKCIIMENQHYHSLLSEFLANQFKAINGQKKSISSLGSYLNFDEIQAESTMMKLIKAFCQEKERKKRKKSNFLQNAISSSIYLRPFKFTWLLHHKQREQFLKKVIPIVWLKDRNPSTLPYKMLKRALITNSKIQIFHKILNQKLMEMSDETLGKKLLTKYGVHCEKHQYEKRGVKIFSVYCQTCREKKIVFEIPKDRTEIGKCRRCSVVKKNYS